METRESRENQGKPGKPGKIHHQQNQGNNVKLACSETKPSPSASNFLAQIPEFLSLEQPWGINLEVFLFGIEKPPKKTPGPESALCIDVCFMAGLLGWEVPVQEMPWPPKQLHEEPMLRTFLEPLPSLVI